MAIDLGVGYVSIVPSTRGLGASIARDLNGSNVQSQVNAAGRKQGGLFKSSFARVAAAGGGLFAGGKFLTAGFDRLTTIQDATKSLTVQLGDAGKAAKLVDDITGTVKGTPFSLSQFADVGQNLVSFGVSAQQIPKYLTAIGDAAATKGKQAPEVVDRLGLALGKAAADGRIMGDTLEALTEAGVPAAQLIADKLGIEQTDVRLLASKGKLVGPEYIDAILEGIEEKQGGLAKGLGDTLSGSLANAKISFARAGANLLAPFTGVLTSSFKGIAGFVDSIGGKLSAFFTALFGQGDKTKMVAADLAGFARAGGAVRDVFVAAAPIAKTALGGVRDAAVDLYQNALKPTLGFLIQNKGIFAVLAGGLVAYKVATLGVAAALKIQAAATKIAAFMTGGFNAALRANPIGAVVTALTLLGVGLYLAYKRSETFRNIVNGAWSAIKTGLAAAWGYISPVLASFRNWLGQVLPPVIRVLGTVFKVYFFAISTYIKVWWAVASKVFSLFVGFLRTTVFPVVRFLYTNVVKPYFGAVGTVISNVWSGVIKPTFGLIRAGVGTLGTVIGSVVGGIRSVWSGLKQAFAGPVEWVLKNVITPLISAINAVSNALTGQSLIKFKMPTVGADKSAMVGGGRASGRARNGGFAGGGWTGPGSKMTPAGVVHADEFVTTKWARRRLERQNPGGLDAMNRTGRWPGYASGGRVRPLAGGTPSTYAGHTGVDFNAPNDFGKPIQAAAAGVVSAVKHLKTSYGNHVWLRHAGGVQTIYAHMSKTLARVGQQVAAGQTIGRVGSTGNSSGPHLHFEVRPGGTYGSAMAFLRGAVTKGATGAGMLGDPVSELRAKIAKIKAGIGGMTGWAKGIASGSIGKLGKQAIAWALGKADDGASLLSPVYGTAKWLKGKLSGDSPKQAARNALKGYGWGDDQWSPLNKLWTRESNWNPRAANPRSSAYGIPQALPGSKMASAGPDWKTNPLTQIKWGLRYIKDRYGSPAAAWAHSQRTGWYANGGRVHAGVYDRGGVVRPGTTMVQNKSRKPEALLSNGQWKAIQALAGIVRRKSGTLGAVNAQLAGQPLPYTLTRKAREQKQQIDKLERQYDRAKTDAERKKIRKQVRDARDDLAETRKQRERVQRLIEKRRVLEVREARRAPRALTGTQSSALLGRFNAMTLGGGSAITSGFLSSQLGVTSRTAEQLRAAFTSARGGALGAANATTRARRGLGIAQANAKPVQQRLAAVDAILAQAKSSDVLRESFRKESETVKKLAKQRADADSKKQRKKIQKQIDAARARQAAIAKEYKTNRNLRNERKKLAADSRLTALTAAQKRLTTATTAQAAADARATAAAEAYKAAQEAAVEKATSIRDAGIGLGSLSSATSKTSGGVIANLRRSISTVGTWGAIAQGLIAKGLRGPIMAEFLEAGPSVEGVRLGRSLLRNNKIGDINALQSQLAAEATRAGAISGAYLANPKALATARAGSYSAYGSAAPGGNTWVIQAPEPTAVAIRREVRGVLMEMQP